MIDTLQRVMEEQKNDFEISTSSGYSVMFTRIFRPNQKSYMICVKKNNSNTYKQVGTIRETEIKLFKEILTGKK